MFPLFLFSTQSGIFKYSKEAQVTSKENLLRVISHDGPQWVPNDMESLVMIAPPVVERPGVAAKDAFGVEWSLEEGAEGGTYPSHGGHTI
jgi:hypothetical protein